MRQIFCCALALIAVTGCAHMIPGTQIADTEDTRAILDLVERYRVAVEAKDINTIVQMTDPSFTDDSGTPSPADDLRYSDLTEKLPARFARLDDIRLNVDVRKIAFAKDDKSATATYSYSLSFRMPTLSPTMQNETELKQMKLKRVAPKQWKIVSGI